MEADLVKEVGVPFMAIPAAGVAGVGSRALPGNLLKLGRGALAARSLIRSFRPDVMLFTGGYLAVPVAFAGWMPGLGKKRPRNLLYVPDIEPGLALKSLARMADHIALTAEESKAFFPARSSLSVTGYPVRKELQIWDRNEALKMMSLAPELPVVLVLGGSRGARQINRALMDALPVLLLEMQVVHVSGQLTWPEVQEAWHMIKNEANLPDEVLARYHPYSYLRSELAPALSAANLVVSRAGASVLGELPLFGLPAVLVPYPYAWRYQKVNARFLESRGAAVVLEETELGGQLQTLVRELIADAPRRAKMQQAMRQLYQPHAAEDIAVIIRSLAAGNSTGGRGVW
jgi:UDP-N-acetylglucosamine--N-acetylmuramyl-(pentapeptide) pyrophosphoryl-undecaprenol N-acetylglucosamine transferase